LAGRVRERGKIATRSAGCEFTHPQPPVEGRGIHFDEFCKRLK
jgi:hypothetical protein